MKIMRYWFRFFLLLCLGLLSYSQHILLPKSECLRKSGSIQNRRMELKGILCIGNVAGSVCTFKEKPLKNEAFTPSNAK